MENSCKEEILELICVIVNSGLGSKVLKTASHSGISAEVVFYGTGTVKNRILEFLELADISKEIVLMAADTSTASAALENLDAEFNFKKPNHGIAFTMPMSAVIYAAEHGLVHKSYGGANNIMHNSIFVIVDRGKAEIVMDTATEAGAKGGTVIKARGSGTYETHKLLHMDIEPEKEIVLILAEASITDRIMTSVSEKLELDKEGNGIIFCQSVNKTYGVL